MASFFLDTDAMVTRVYAERYLPADENAKLQADIRYGDWTGEAWSGVADSSDHRICGWWVPCNAVASGVVPAPLVVAVHSFFDLFHDSDKLDLVQTPDQQFSSPEVRHYSWGEVFIYILLCWH